MQRVKGSERHCATPRSGVVARMLRPVSCQQHPSFSESSCAIKLDEIISILTFEIAGGTNHQDRPTLSWIEIRRRRQNGDRIWRYNVSALGSQRFFLRAQRDVALHR
jgi:hypothetical protein